MWTLFLLGELESNEVTPSKTDLSEAKKKIVRFGRGEGRSMEDDSGWSEPQIKDSGIDTGLSSSNQTLFGDILKVIKGHGYLGSHVYAWGPAIVHFFILYIYIWIYINMYHCFSYLYRSIDLGFLVPQLQIHFFTLNCLHCGYYVWDSRSFLSLLVYLFSCTFELIFFFCLHDRC